MNHDDDLREFFGALRAQDEQQTPPPFVPFPKRKAVGSRRYLWPLAAAAAAILLLLTWWPAAGPSPSNSTVETLVISIEVTENTQTQTLLSPPASIDSWESPSASLIADF